MHCARIELEFPREQGTLCETHGDQATYPLIMSHGDWYIVSENKFNVPEKQRKLWEYYTEQEINV